MSIKHMTKITLCEEALDDLALQIFALEAEIEFVEKRQQWVRQLKERSKASSPLWALNLYLKPLAEQAGRARANLVVAENNRTFFEARLQKLLEGSDG